MAMIKRRLLSRSDIEAFPREALEITESLSPPEQLVPQVFASALTMVGQHEVTEIGAGEPAGARPYR